MKIRPQIEVQIARAEHLDRILELWESSMQYHSTLNPEFFNQNMIDKDLYLTTLEVSLGYQPIFVLRIGDTIEGYATIEEIYTGISHFNNVPYCKIGDFVIAQKYRRRGYGNRIFREIKKWAKEQEIRRIDLDVYAKNEQAVNFYREFGFKETFYKMSINIT